MLYLKDRNEAVTTQDTGEVVTLLTDKDFPKGIERQSLAFEIEYKNPLAKQHHDKGRIAYADWLQSGDPTTDETHKGTRDESLLEQAIEHFEVAVDLCTKSDDQPALAENLSDHANMLVFAGQSEEGARELKQALNIHKVEKEAGRVHKTLGVQDSRLAFYPPILYDTIYHDLGSLHAALYSTARQKRAQGDLEAVQEIFLQLSEIQQEIVGIFPQNKGEKAAEDARFVRQGEMGFSSNERIGTNNVNECLCLMLHDPVTDKTMLSHIDDMTDIKTLNDGLKRMPKHTGVRLQARLLGARIDKKGKADAHGRSLSNIERTIRFLQDIPEEIEIISARLLDPKQAVCVVVNPKDFTITEESPMYGSSDIIVGGFWQERPKASEKEAAMRPLGIAFDLTAEKQASDLDQASELDYARAPVLYSRKTVQKIRDICVGKSHEALCDWFYDQIGLSGYEQRAMAIEQNIRTGIAYSEAFEAIQKALEQKIETFAAEGMTITEEEHSAVMTALEKCPIYAKDNADIANKLLVEEIENHLFTQEEGLLQVHPEALEQFEFSGQAYDRIEKELSTNRIEKGLSFRSHQSRVSAEESDRNTSRRMAI